MSAYYPTLAPYVLALYVSITAFLISYAVLDAKVPEITVRRVGGLLFWRAGRLGGSFYLARKGN